MQFHRFTGSLSPPFWSERGWKQEIYLLCLVSGILRGVLCLVLAWPCSLASFFSSFCFQCSFFPFFGCTPLTFTSFFQNTLQHSTMEERNPCTFLLNTDSYLPVPEKDVCAKLESNDERTKIEGLKEVRFSYSSAPLSPIFSFTIPSLQPSFLSYRPSRTSFAASSCPVC